MARPARGAARARASPAAPRAPPPRARDARPARGRGHEVREGAMPPFVAYHGVDAATHQAKVDELAPQGFRPITLSVSGAPADARYAACWVQRPGPAWWAVH